MLPGDQEQALNMKEANTKGKNHAQMSRLRHPRQSGFKPDICRCEAKNGNSVKA